MKLEAKARLTGARSTSQIRFQFLATLMKALKIKDYKDDGSGYGVRVNGVTLEDLTASLKSLGWSTVKKIGGFRGTQFSRKDGSWPVDVRIKDGSLWVLVDLDAEPGSRAEKPARDILKSETATFATGLKAFDPKPTFKVEPNGDSTYFWFTRGNEPQASTVVKLIRSSGYKPSHVSKTVTSYSKKSGVYDVVVTLVCHEDQAHHFSLNVVRARK